MSCCSTLNRLPKSARIPFLVNRDLSKDGPIFIPILCFDEIFHWCQMETIFDHKICCLNVVCRKFSGWFPKPASAQIGHTNVNQLFSLKNYLIPRSVSDKCNASSYAATTGSRSSRRMCSVKKMLLKISQISQEITCVGVVQGLKLY